MALNGGSIWIDKNTDGEIEDVLQMIINDKHTTIELLHENAHDPHYLYKIQFDSDKFFRFFKKSRQTRSPRVLILKILTHYEPLNPAEHDYEVKVHKQLSSSTINHYPICPSFLYSKRTQLGKEQDKTLEEAICSILRDIEQEIYVKEEKTERIYKLYDRLTDHSVKKVKGANQKIYFSSFNFKDATQTIIFMEYTDCDSLYNCFVSKSLGKYMINLHDETLPFLKFGSDKLESIATCFTSFVLLYIAILLLKEGIIHGDLHSGNVLICKNDEGIVDVVVIDFGRSFFLEEVYIRKNRHIGLKEHADNLPLDIQSIYDDVIKEVKVDKHYNRLNMRSYFDDLIANGEFIKAATASTMFYSPAEYNRGQNWSHFDFYMYALLQPEEKQTYADIYQYTRPFCKERFDFERLIGDVLVAREQFYDENVAEKENMKCQFLMGEHNILNSSDYKRWVVRNHSDKGGVIDSGVFADVNECHKAGDYYKPELYKGQVETYLNDKKMVAEKAEAERLAAQKAAADRAAAVDRAAADRAAADRAAADKAAADRAAVQKMAADRAAARKAAADKAAAQKAAAERLAADKAAADKAAAEKAEADKAEAEKAEADKAGAQKAEADKAAADKAAADKAAADKAAAAEAQARLASLQASVRATTQIEANKWIKNLPYELKRPDVNIDNVNIWLKNNFKPQLTPFQTQIYVDTWKERDLANKDNARAKLREELRKQQAKAIAEEKAQSKKDSSNEVNKSKSAFFSIGSMFSKKPLNQKTTPSTAPAPEETFAVGGKSIRRRYYNYKKTRKGIINKIYSKKIKIKRLKIKTKERKIKTKGRKIKTKGRRYRR